MTTADFAVRYEALSDSALTQLASEGGLRPEAEIALSAELQRRSIDAKEVSALRVEQERVKLQTAANNPYFYQGTGLRFRGKKFLTESDQRHGITVVTRWIVFAFMPLIPLGSYRVKQPTGWGKTEIISKLPLQWDQVWKGWGSALLVVLGFFVMIRAMIVWSELHR